MAARDWAAEGRGLEVAARGWAAVAMAGLGAPKAGTRTGEMAAQVMESREVRHSLG